MTLDKFGILKLYPTRSNPPGNEWYSTAWNNGHKRTVGLNQFDTYDRRFGVTGTGSYLGITGSGTAVASPNTTTQSFRMWVDGPWRNTEMTAYVNVKYSNGSIQLRSRSNHHGVQGLPYGYYQLAPGRQISCGFGCYNVKWGQDGSNEVSCEVEVIHDVYRRKLGLYTFQKPPNGMWVGYKQITRNKGPGHVLVEGYANRGSHGWVKETQFEYDGTNVHVDYSLKQENVAYCVNRPDYVAQNVDKYTVWQNNGKWCWLRLEGLVNTVYVKNFSVREIAPI